MSIEIVALVATALLALAVAFQVGLAVGAPWGWAAYGGRAVTGAGALPAAYRCASGGAALTLLGAMWIVLASVSLVGRGPLSGSVLTVMPGCHLRRAGRGLRRTSRGSASPGAAASCRAPPRRIVR
jgi:hypothetical protein